MQLDRVECCGLGKRYGLQRALYKVDVNLHAGQVCALLGGNGAGKSTLLGLISSLIAPTQGNLRYFCGAQEQRAGAGLRHEIGVVAHDSFLYPGLTALENLQFWGKLYSVAHIEKRSEELLQQVQLAKDAWTRPASTYSRGMIQRLSLARTMLHAPSLLLLDEPFTGLDRQGVKAFGQALQEAKARKAIVLVITHDVTSIAGLATHLVVLKQGRLAHQEHQDRPYNVDELKQAYHAHAQ